jgi:hypothetical protein
MSLYLSTLFDESHGMCEHGVVLSQRSLRVVEPTFFAQQDGALAHELSQLNITVTLNTLLIK